MLPAGVDTKTPSEIRCLIICFLPFEIVNDAVCLLCRRTEISLIAINFLIMLLLLLTLISNGEIETSLALVKLL